LEVEFRNSPDKSTAWCFFRRQDASYFGLEPSDSRKLGQNPNMIRVSLIHSVPRLLHSNIRPNQARTLGNVAAIPSRAAASPGKCRDFA
jgi:hypothetical protein